jgi:osmotically-inducible protein OsmY
MKYVRPLVLILSLAAIGTPAGAAQKNDSKDVKLAAEVAAVLDRSDRYTIFDEVIPHVEEGIVTLTGKVTDAAKSSEIERQVRRVSGVADVRNLIQALPASRFDDQIRRDLFNAIYGNPNFLQYGSLSRPPIHILVEGGHVTLTGTVLNDMDRRLAHSLARQVKAQSITNKLRTTAEGRTALSW